VAEHILITGFEPFGGESVNPSELLARNLNGRLIGGRLVIGRVLPVETLAVRERLERLIRTESPVAVICIGQALGRTALALEQVAVNVLDFAQSDNAGIVLRNTVIRDGGPHARAATLPNEAILAAWREGAIPGYLSGSAGTYVCNQVLYELLSILEAPAPVRPGMDALPAGFVHTPALPQQALRAGAAGMPSMPYDLMERGIELLVATLGVWLTTRPRAATVTTTRPMATTQ